MGSPELATDQSLQTVMVNLTSGSPTVVGRNLSYYVDLGKNWANSTGNWTVEATQKSDEDTELWLTIRIIIIIGVIVGLVCLAWGSYSIHRKCYSDKLKERHQYQKAMLL